MNKQDLIKGIEFLTQTYSLICWSDVMVKIKQAVEQNDWGTAQELANDLEAYLDVQRREINYLIEDIETNDDFGRTE